MSPRQFTVKASRAVLEADDRLWFGLGRQVRDARLAKSLSVAQLAGAAGVSSDVLYLIEAGRRTSTEAVLRVTGALNMRLEFALTDPRRRNPRPSLASDLVHSAMGEFEARHFRSLGRPSGLDEPYQHYQFAGRADLIAWDMAAAAFLHIENRTRFPDLQEMAGSFNAKKAYLGEALAARLGVPRWHSETHVIAALWSAEVMHALRLRPESFRSLCPDGPQGFAAWWSGALVTRAARATSTLVLIDPLATGRQRTWIGLEDALTARPRYRGYADAAAELATHAA